ncbi:hypothetical protein RGU75_09355 [Glaciimonas sp. CA11.2]|uniref:hypothetical protein n=1 Tax=Glaciimonas sp. CA11.2 TaxID=3048601 RepID=UPI002AB46D64|nr:hypothetical protein [Glaciimonas sp. CA11.2]MDY7546437.1 hypothetical protein [Glaciimonas sp. CA11.2]
MTTNNTQHPTLNNINRASATPRPDKSQQAKRTQRSRAISTVIFTFRDTQPNLEMLSYAISCRRHWLPSSLPTRRSSVHHWQSLTHYAYSGQRDRSFWPIVTAAPAMLLRG